MKKIVLLLVAAVFVIGIQSCSTEENVFEELENDQITEKQLNLNGLYDEVIVHYPESMTEELRSSFLLYMKAEFFPEIILTESINCANMEIWLVPQVNNSFNKHGKLSKKNKGELVVEVSDPEEDEDTGDLVFRFNFGWAFDFLIPTCLN